MIAEDIGSCSSDDREIDKKNVMVDQKLKSILSDRFFRETTMHGFSHLSNAASVQGVVFWMIVTLSAFAMAGYQIVNDLKKLYSEEMTINFRQPKIKDDENKLPVVDFCYNTWIHWFDFDEAYRVRNLTGEEISYLTSTFAGHLIPRRQCVNDTKVRGTLIRKFGTLIPLDELMKSLMLKDLRRRCQKKNANCYFTPMPSKLCMQFSLSKIAQNAKEVIFFNQRDTWSEFFLLENDKHGETNIVGHLLMNSKTFMIVDKEADVVGHDLTVMPSAVNMPASHVVDCPKINQPTFHEARINGISPVIAAKLFCKGTQIYHKDQNSNYTFKFRWREQIFDVERKPGLKCYRWSYVSSGHRKLQGKTTNRIFILITVEKNHSWIITEYIPVLTWEQLIANIGGTLGIWTGASILSFIHLMHFVLLKSVRR